MSIPKAKFLARLCDIDITKQMRSEYNFESYILLHSRYKVNPDFLTILFNYGCLMHYRFKEFQDKNDEFDEIDNEYSSAIEHLKLLKTLLFGKDIQLDIKDGIGNAHKLKSPSIICQNIIENTALHIIDALNRNGFLQMDNDSIFGLLHKSNFFEDWKNKNNPFDSYVNMIEKFKKYFDIKPITVKEDISLKYIDLLLLCCNPNKPHIIIYSALFNYLYPRKLNR